MLLVVVLIVFVPTGMIAVQPDLGTAILIVLSGAVVVFLAGLGWRYIVAVAALAGAAMPALWVVMHDYQRKRIWTLLDPESDPLGAGYHIIQSKIAIGSGGVFGKGWLNGTQGQLGGPPCLDGILSLVDQIPRGAGFLPSAREGDARKAAQAHIAALPPHRGAEHP